MGNNQGKRGPPPKPMPLSSKLAANGNVGLFLVKKLDEEALAALRAKELAEAEARAPPMVVGSSAFELTQTKVRDPALNVKRTLPVGQAAADTVKSSGGGLLSKIRKLVSKKKHRYQDDTFDLDLTYITENIVAMGFPSEGLEGAYRNPMPEVQQFFDTRHPDSFKVYNLCSERSYDAEKFHNRAVRYPFDDHNCPSFAMIHHLCMNVESFLMDFAMYQQPPSLPTLNEHGMVTVPAPIPLPPAQQASVAAGRSKLKDKPMCNRMKVQPESVVPVAVIHCKAGKGRTGLMICCLMLYLKLFETAEQSLAFYGKQRTSNAKGVTIPSQQRYVHYYEQYLKWINAGAKLPTDSISLGSFEKSPLRLKTIRLNGVPNFDVGGGCDPYFKLFRVDGKVFYDYRKNNTVNAYKHEEFIDFQCNTILSGDVKVFFWDADAVKDDKMFGLWVNTGIVERSNIENFDEADKSQEREFIVRLTKDELDGPHKNPLAKNFPADFSVELFFATIPGQLHTEIEVAEDDSKPVDDDEEDAEPEYTE